MHRTVDTRRKTASKTYPRPSAAASAPIATNCCLSSKNYYSVIASTEQVIIKGILFNK